MELKQNLRFLLQGIAKCRIYETNGTHVFLFIY